MIPLVFLTLGATAFDAGVDYVFTRKLLVFVIVFLITITLGMVTKADLRRRGITGDNDLTRVMVAAPLSRVSFWNQPRIAAILAPPPADRRSDDSPAEQLREIIRVSDELVGVLHFPERDFVLLEELERNPTVIP